MVVTDDRVAVRDAIADMGVAKGRVLSGVEIGRKLIRF